jgi:hypothetical protein
MYHRKNYVLGAGQPSDEVFDPGPTLTGVLTSVGTMLVVGGAILGYVVSRPARKVRNAMIGGAAAFAVSYFMKPPEIAVVVDDQLEPEYEESF